MTAKLIAVCPGNQILGHCPACHKPVALGDDPVWTCPANLSDDNPHQAARDPLITKEMQEEAGMSSFCGTDFGLPCYEDMPLHGACYDGDELTW